MASTGKSQQVKARPKHILHLSAEERRRFLDSFDSVYSDIDGVVWDMKHRVPQAAEGLKALQRAGKTVTFLSNNSVRKMEDTVQQFEKIGLEVTPEQIWHPAKTTVHYLNSIQFKGVIYIIASPHFKAYLREAGYEMIDGPNQPIEDTHDALKQHIFDPKPVDAVIIDMDFNLNSVKILRAHQYLRYANCQLLIGCTDRFFTVTKDVRIIGPGFFSSILVEASDKVPIVLGKPGKELGNQLLHHQNIKEPQRVLMIGDMLAQDIRFGCLCGFQTLLVLSGGTTLEQLQAETDAEQLPDYYADSLGDFLQLLGEETVKAHV